MRIHTPSLPSLLMSLSLVLGLPAAAEPTKQAAAPRTAAFTETPSSQLGTRHEGLGLAPGSSVQDARVADVDGKPVQLSELFKRGPVLVVFYRGGWCPYCNFQIRELTQAHAEFQKRGITPVAISVDAVQQAAKTQAGWKVPFPVLSDPDLAAHEAFRVVYQAGDAEVEKLKGYGIDLEASSGRKHHRFAVASLFFVGRDGVVRWAHADRDYKVRPKTAQVLEAIDGVLKASTRKP